MMLCQRPFELCGLAQGSPHLARAIQVLSQCLARAAVGESNYTIGLAQNLVRNTSVLDQSSLHPQLARGQVIHLATTFV